MLANERLRFKLHSLNYPTYDIFNISDTVNVRNVVVWLEDRLIRALPADVRLRDVQSPEWITYLNKYLQTLKCPFNESNSWAMLDWLLSRALLLESSSPETNTAHNNVSVDASSNASANAFSSVDVNTNEFKENVLKMAKLLQIPSHPDIKTLFKAICLVIEQKLEVNILNAAVKDYGTFKIDMLKLDDVCLGFEVSDPSVKAAAVALRILNINRLRRLQDQANAGIVQVQKLTADPKTDEKLGKVGF
ncbi:unnamed protein product [Heterobilharzia americana]|nr:unnamed protein product [Heterobilharzia americana]